MATFEEDKLKILNEKGILVDVVRGAIALTKEIRAMRDHESYNEVFAAADEAGVHYSGPSITETVTKLESRIIEMSEVIIEMKEAGDATEKSS